MPHDVISSPDGIALLDSFNEVMGTEAGWCYFLDCSYQEAKEACQEAIRRFPTALWARCVAAEIESWETGSLPKDRVLDCAGRAVHVVKWGLQVRQFWGELDPLDGERPGAASRPSGSIIDHLHRGIDYVVVSCIRELVRTKQVVLAAKLHSLWAGWCWENDRTLPLRGMLSIWILQGLDRRTSPPPEVWFTLATASVRLAIRTVEPVVEEAFSHLPELDWQPVIRAAEHGDATATALVFLADHAAHAHAGKSPFPPRLATRGRELLACESADRPIPILILSDLWGRLKAEEEAGE
jgi:hypothetical protein